MSAPLRFAGFVAALVGVFGLALVVGHLTGPVGEPADARPAGHAAGGVAEHDAGAEAGEAGAHEEMAQDHGDAHDEAEAGHDGATASAAAQPGGLSVSEDGYTLVLDETVSSPGRDRPVSFVIEGPDGPVTDVEVRHERDLHLIAVRRDFSGFQHVHPELAADGTWTTRLDLTPGPWRILADVAPTGAEPMTLGADLAVPGPWDPDADPAAGRTAQVDGYTVRLSGDARAGRHATLRLRVERDGRPVEDLEPYLGAAGHLVALRGGDLAYLHVHPLDSATAGPEIAFEAEVPSAGTYHLYLDFKHDGVVRTARFSLDAARG